MEYKIIETKRSAQKLEEAVNHYIQEGWEPMGGVAVGYSTDSTNWWYYQAMVRKAQK
jgi:hypothetical protein